MAGLDAAQQLVDWTITEARSDLDHWRKSDNVEEKTRAIHVELCFATLMTFAKLVQTFAPEAAVEEVARSILALPSGTARERMQQLVALKPPVVVVPKNPPQGDVRLN